MRRLMGLVLAGALLAGTASNVEAQVSIGIGNPYGGGSFINSGYGTGYGYPGYGLGYPVYGAGYGAGYSGAYGAGYGGGGFGYSSGYRGVVGPGYGYGYGYRPVARPFGYGGNRGYGYGGGFRPFGGMFRR